MSNQPAAAAAAAAPQEIQMVDMASSIAPERAASMSLAKRKKIMKKATDYDGAGFFSKLSFWWVNPLLVLGRKNELDEAMLQLPKTESAFYAFKKFEEIWNVEKNNPSPLIRTIKARYLNAFLRAGAFKLCWSIFLLLAAFYFVRDMVAYVQSKPVVGTWDHSVGYIKASGFFVCCMLLSMSLQQMSSQCSRLGIRLRAAMLTAVYRKALKVDGVASCVGDVLTLVTSDCQRLLEGVTNIHYLWSGPIEAVAIVCLLIYLVGYEAFVALGIISILVPGLFITGKFITNIRARQNTITDKRVQVIHEVVLAIKLVKFYAWEKSFTGSIATMREKENELLKQSGNLKSLNLMIVFLIPPLMAFSIFGIYILLSGKLTPVVAFTTLSLFNTLRFPLIVLPKALKSFVESRQAAVRIEAFLQRKEAPPLPKSDKSEIVIENASFRYVEDKIALKNVNLKLEKGHTLAIVGPLGGGKSTVINAILGEAQVAAGKISVGGKFAYVPQTPWIQHATVRDNILFGKPFDEARYKHVCHACALETDFKMLAQGDMTEIGERGINLSGGQKQRIALARAVYADNDVYLLDSVLSAVDQHTCKHIMDYCIKGVLNEKTIIVVTHQLHILHSFDQVMYIRNGTMEYCGPYTKDFIPTYYPSLANEISEVAVSAKHEDDSKKEAKNDAQKPEQKEAKKEEADDGDDESDLLDTDKTATGDSMAAFGQWFRAGGRGAFAGALLIAVITQLTRIGSDWWISQWTANTFNEAQSWYITIYGILVGIFACLLLIRGLSFYGVCRGASTSLHNAMFKRVIQAPISYFTVTPLGRLLTSFSRDQDVVDEGLPDITMLTLVYGLILLSTLILVMIVLPLYAVVAGALLLSFFFLQTYYMRSSRLMKSLASSTSAPIFAYVSESLTGIAVVRAFEATDRFNHVILNRVDRNSTALFNLDHIQLWLAFRLDTIGAMLVYATSLYCVIFIETVSPSAAGLAISNSIQKLVFFTWVVRGFADAQSLVNSVERINNYATTAPQEKAHEIAETKPAKNWPPQGAIEYKGVVMGYFDNAPPVLRGIDFSIRGCEKIGVVGRTGSGKSTLIMALFRLCELKSGQIFVDGTNTATLGLAELRSRLSIIPQEPVLFKGTVRTNLDPFYQYSDDEVWRALELSHLKNIIQQLPEKLESEVEENGDNFSLGQKQLFCLARAVLNQSKILVLDEATAAMDLETDALIRHTINDVFKERTVITIAHRLDTIIGSDRILVMGEGKLIEFDTPRNLLSNPNSSFSQLVEQAGSSAASLKAIAFSKGAPSPVSNVAPDAAAPVVVPESKQ